ncbi:MAG TPA: nucleotide sugar dehydrogenase [Actinomycetota bacterium]|nr:nucleotide sugar dehydrogenase [Actinomycetota bacterium]
MALRVEAAMRETAALRRKILSRSATVAVLGQGYVGLTVSCVAAEDGFRVLGIDVDERRVADLAEGNPTVPGVDEDLFLRGRATGRIEFTDDPEGVREADVILICVPTPVKDHAPDLSFVVGACRDVAPRLQGGRLVVLESTTYPGTTEELCRPILETSGLVAGRDFLLAYSPERIDPGNHEYGFRNTPRVVGGLTPESTGVAALFYGQLVDKVVVVSSCRAAELSKLLENTFRHVNVALVNELAIQCHEMGIDVWEVIESAATKPFGFMPFYPGPGVGGHCIPLDPTYLSWQVRREAGRQFRILEEAQDINAQMPAYVAARIGEALNEAGRALKGADILVLGVSYKPDIGDVRESPAVRVMYHLLRRGARVSFHDPYVPEVAVNGRALARADLTNRAVANADCVALLTPHRAYDLDWIASRARLVFDARNAYGPDRRPNVVRL